MAILLLGCRLGLGGRGGGLLCIRGLLRKFASSVGSGLEEVKFRSGPCLGGLIECRKFRSGCCMIFRGCLGL